MIFRRSQVFALTAAFALALLAASLFAPRAQAFTFEDKAATPGGAPAAGIADPDDRLTSRFDDGKKTVIRRGNSTIYFGGAPQSFDQRNDPNQYFNPNTLMGR
jgi:hypothetical protein